MNHVLRHGGRAALRLVVAVLAVAGTLVGVAGTARADHDAAQEPPWCHAIDNFMSDVAIGGYLFPFVHPDNPQLGPEFFCNGTNRFFRGTAWKNVPYVGTEGVGRFAVDLANRRRTAVDITMASMEGARACSGGGGVQVVYPFRVNCPSPPSAEFVLRSNTATGARACAGRTATITENAAGAWVFTPNGGPLVFTVPTDTQTECIWFFPTRAAQRFQPDDGATWNGGIAASSPSSAAGTWRATDGATGQAGSGTVGGATAVHKNFPPTVLNRSATTPFNTAVDVEVLNGPDATASTDDAGPWSDPWEENDRNQALDPASFRISSAPGGGTASAGPLVYGTAPGPVRHWWSGAIRYTPNPGFSGTDTFRYQVCDYSPPFVMWPALCSEATLSVTVEPDPTLAIVTTGDVDDPQNVGQTLNGYINIRPTSNAPSIRALIDRIQFLPSCRVTPGVGASGITCSSPDGGAYSMDPALRGAGSCASIGFSGATTDASTGLIQISESSARAITLPMDQDCRINFTLRVLRMPADADVAAAGSQTNFGVLSAGYPVGYPTRRASNASNGSSTVNGPANQAPFLFDDSAITPDNSSIIITVLANDSDPDGTIDPASVRVSSGPASGSVVVNADGTVTYTPNIGFVGFDTFDYRACDNGAPALCDTATVTVEVQPPGGVGGSGRLPT